MSQSNQPDGHEPDTSWFDIAIDKRGNTVILDYAPGWESYSIEFHWEDTFAIKPPSHLPVGAYRWTGFNIGYWGDDDHINIHGGEFIPLNPSRHTIGEQEEVKRLEECLSKANASSEQFERQWYLKGDVLEASQNTIASLKETLGKVEAALEQISRNDSDGLHLLTPQAMQHAANEALKIVKEALNNQDDSPCTDCDDTGITIQTERRCTCVPAAKSESEAVLTARDALFQIDNLCAEEIRQNPGYVKILVQDALRETARFTSRSKAVETDPK